MTLLFFPTLFCTTGNLLYILGRRSSNQYDGLDQLDRSIVRSSVVCCLSMAHTLILNTIGNAKTNKLDKISRMLTRGGCIYSLCLQFTFQKTTRSAVSELCLIWVVTPETLAKFRRSENIAANFRVTFLGLSCVKSSRRLVGHENLKIE